MKIGARAAAAHRRASAPSDLERGEGRVAAAPQTNGNDRPGLAEIEVVARLVASDTDRLRDPSGRGSVFAERVNRVP
jgi:hypothetical protein